MNLQELNDRFRIPGVAEIISDRGGLPAVWVEGSKASHGASATVYLLGAHVASWHPRHGEGAADVLWLSGKSHWSEGKAIRGGVPICFPWFGPNKQNATLPAHGFARLRTWTLEAIATSSEGVTVTLVIKSDQATRALWPHDFLLRHHVTIGRELAMTLALTNTGKEAFVAEEAQHTYFGVGDVRQVRVTGLADVKYIDKVDGAKEKSQEGDITVTQETDRVYLDTTGPVRVEDPVKRRRITVKKEFSHNTVVWNPWIDKARAMADFGDEEWPGMVCVETCNVMPGVTVKPGETHRMVTHIEVQAL